MTVLNEKHRRIIAKAAAAVRNRGHEGDAQLADSLNGILASCITTRLAAERAPAAAPAPVAASDIEAAAKAVYELLPTEQGCNAQTHPWTPGGNSMAQDQARRYARAALAAAPAAAPIAQPVAIVDAGDEGMFAEILPDVSVKVGQHLYAAPTPASSTAAAKDAARYRYLRDTATLETAVWEALEGHGSMDEDGNLDAAGYRAGFDQAVDKAIAAIASSAGEVKP